MKISIFISSILLFLIFSSNDHSQNYWKFSEYSIEFSGAGAEGNFAILTGKILFDPNDLSASKFDVFVDVGSISTGNETKDNHAKGESWFDASKFPQIHFISKNISKKGGSYIAQGVLEMRGIQKQIEIPFEFEKNADEGKGKFKGALSVNREDYGIYGNFIAFMVDSDFEVEIEVNVFR